METFKFKILTKLKDDIKDPSGNVVEDISKKLNIINSSSVKVGKFYEITFEEENEKKAYEKIEKLAKEVLTNPIVETYLIEKG